MSSETLSIFDIDKLFPVVKVRGPREPTVSSQEQDVSVAESIEPFIESFFHWF